MAKSIDLQPGDTAVIIGIGPSGAREVFCNDCGQLRLWLRSEKPESCGNCASADIKVGPFGGKELPALKAQWRKLRAI